MKHFSIIISDPCFVKNINVDTNKINTVQDLKKHLSDTNIIPDDQFIFNNSISPDQKLSSISDNTKFEVKFLHPSEDLTFIFPDGLKIKARKAFKMNVESIIKELTRHGKVYFSDVYIKKKALHLEIFGIEIPEGNYHLQYIPESIPINVILAPQTIIIPFDDKQFIFYENEYVEKVELLLKMHIGEKYSFAIRDLSLNVGLFKKYQLDPKKKYRIICTVIYEFIPPVGKPIKTPPIDYYATFGDAKGIIKQLCPFDIPQGKELIFYVGDKRVSDDNLLLKDFIGRERFYFEIEDKNKIKSSATITAANPTKTKPTNKPDPSKQIQSQSSDKKEPTTPPSPLKQETKPKMRPKVKVSYTEVNEEIEIYFNFDENVERKLMVMKEKFKTNTKIEEMINTVKRKNEIKNEIEFRLQEDDECSIIDHNQTLGSIEEEIEQRKNKKILYVGLKNANNKETKTETKSKDKFKPKPTPKSESDSEEEENKQIANIIDSSLISKLQPQLKSRSNFLGEGGTSKVYKVKFIDDSNKYDEKVKTYKALKVLKNCIISKKLTKWSDDDDEEDSHNEEEEELQINMQIIKRFYLEYAFLHDLNHPNIVQTFGFYYGDKENGPSILLEYFKHNLSNSINIITEEIYLIGIIHELSDVMKFIHEKKIIHRDLKPSNILLTNNKHVKLTDFGISKLIETDTQTATETNTAGVGTVLYMAPEIINSSGKYNEKVDVYSFGVVVHYILSRGETPIFDIKNATNNKRAKMSNKINKTAQEFINQCLSLLPDERPSFNQIVDYLNENELKLIDGIESQSDKLREHLENR